MAICIYPQNCEDFSTNGLGILTPIECTVTEEAAGMYELEVVHPIDHTNRWAQIVAGNIIKAPVPVRESPLYEAGVVGTQTVTRQIYKVTDKCAGCVRKKNGTLTNVGNIPKGRELVMLELNAAQRSGINYHRVINTKNGAERYVSENRVEWLREETEVITAAAPATQAIVHSSVSNDQLFRIYSVETDSDAGTVTARAMHIFYDLRGDIINGQYNPVSIAASEVVPHMAGLLLLNDDFVFHADGAEGLVNCDCSYKSPVEALLNPDEGIVSTSGSIFLRDNWDVFILPDYVRDRQVTVRRGKNLIGVRANHDDADVVTRIIPVGQTVKGSDFLLSGSTPWVDSEHIGDYPTIRVKRENYDVKLVDKDWDNVTTFRNNDSGKALARARLRELAQNDFDAGADLPNYGLDVDFVLLQNASGFEDYAGLQTIHLYDIVTVIDKVVGIKAKVRCTGYTWNCLTQQYDSMTLGELKELKQQIYNFNIPSGGISGTKIAPNSADGAILREASIQYAKITAAAIEQLSVDALNAQTAHIGELDAQSIETDELAAAFAHMASLVADRIESGEITAQSLAAEVARMNAVSIAEANINFAKIVDADIENLIAHDAITDKYFIHKLMVENLQVLEQTVGNLVVKASDGNYYKMDIVDGAVTPTQVTVTDGEIEAGVTASGKSIIETTILAEDLSATNIKGINALIDRITASRINVDTLMAREAFVTRLYTSEIFGGKSIQTIAGDVDGIHSIVYQDGEGAHFRNSMSDNEVLIDSESVNIVQSGRKYSKFAADYVQFGNYQLRRTADGGLVFKMQQEGGA